MKDTPSILVVSNPEAAGEITSLLREGGFEHVHQAGGGDDSYALYESLAPAVVVLCASLDQGDARSLAAALRAGPHGEATRLVLVGDDRGPIRNALDAADFDVDRFVSRPLAAKALLFAVRACVDAARRSASGEDGAARQAEVERITGTRRLDEAMEDAIASFVDEAMSALGGAPTALASADGVVSAPLDDASLSTAPTALPAFELPAVREPTLILSGGGVSRPPPAAPADEPVDVELGPALGESPWDDDDLDAADDDLDDLDGDADDLDGDGDDLDDRMLDDLDSPPPSVRRAATSPERPGGDGLGVELRRKMTAMAERLFPGMAGDKLRVNLAHDAHTEIDLTAISAETQSGVAGAPYSEIGGGDTFADTNPLAALEPTPAGEGGTPHPDTGEATGRRRPATGESTGRRRAQTGELPTRGDLAALDIATLLARLWSRAFTGKVVFRRAPAEKVVSFEDGRPVFATSNLPHDRMGDLLYREGKITRAQHRQARDLVVESGRRMGEILVELGFIKPRELLPTVRRHLEDIIYSLFAWDAGEFVATSGDATGERIRLTRHPAALVLEGVRRKYQQAMIESRLGSPSALVVARPSRQLSALVSVADLSPAERALVFKLDGERSVEAAARSAETELLAAMQLAFVLVALGVAEVVDRGHGDTASLPSPRGPSLVGETDLAIDRQRVMTKHALVAEADYFTLLGVRRDATAFEIRRAFEAARRDFAVDSFPAELQRELADELADIGQLLDEAYRVLRDDRVRTSYLSHLRD
jgi:CheY-like chemotaxis protein